MHIGSNVHVDRTCVLRRWGSVTVHRRWGDVWSGGQIGQRWKENSPWIFLKLGDRTTVKDQQWGELGVTGVGQNRRLLRWLDWHLLRWLDWRLVREEIGVCFATMDRRSVRWSAFGSLTDRRLDRSFSGSLSLLVRWVFSFSGSLSLLRVEGNSLKVK